MACKVRQIRRKGKAIGIVPVPKAAAPEVDARVALIQALIPVALDRVYEELKAEVERLAGARYVREGRPPGHVRWTAQRGSIYLADQKIPIQVPRVRDRMRNVEVPLPIYARLQEPRACDTGLLHRVLGGLSTREYERCAEAVPEAFGLSASTVSRRFIRASARKLQELSDRRLDGYDFVALMLDGKTFAEDEMVVAVGVTLTGDKVLLGFVQTATENRKVCAAFLRELVDRGLHFDLGLLAVTEPRDCMPPSARSSAPRRSCIAANGISAKTSWSIFRSGIARPFGGSCRPPMSNRPTRRRSARSASSARNWCCSMHPRRPV